MKTIDNYINERLNPKRLGHTMGEFPSVLTLENIIEYLKDCGFEEVEFEPGTNFKYRDASNELNRQNRKCFVILGSKIYGGGMKGIMFGDTSKHKVSERYPAYLIVWHYRNPDNPIYGTSTDKTGVDMMDKDDFLKVIKDRFGFLIQ
jgi:hypothetical protein